MKKWLIIGAVFAALLAAVGLQHNSIGKLEQERDRYRDNTTVLMGDVEQYRTRDSLNAATIGALRMTIDEYETFRAADAELIRTLRASNRDLQRINNVQAETIMELSAVPRDTVIIRDSIPIPAVAVHTGDVWYDFSGLLTEKEFTGTLAVRDSLLLVESVQYKRCLFFKTKKIKNRKLDVVSKNPHTTIVGCEHIIIEK